VRTTVLGVTITDAATDEKATTVFYMPVSRDPPQFVTTMNRS
jgi:hypothetical protein